MQINPNVHFVFPEFDISELNEIVIQNHCGELITQYSRGFYDLHPLELTINHGVFETLDETIGNSSVEVFFIEKDLILSCGCIAPKKKLCLHQARVLFNIIRRSELRLFFDDKLRNTKLKDAAKPYGIENEDDLENFLRLEYRNKGIEIKPVSNQLFPVTTELTKAIQEKLFPVKPKDLSDRVNEFNNAELVVVLKQHKYYKHLYIELYHAATTQNGKIKNPLISVNPLEVVWKTNSSEEIKFFTGISRFQNTQANENSQADLKGLEAIMKNPLRLNFYYHNNESSDSVTANSVLPLNIGNIVKETKIEVHKKEDFYEVNSLLKIDNRWVYVEDISLRYDYFIYSEDKIHLVGDEQTLRTLHFFKQNHNTILIHSSKYEEFRLNILTKLEDKFNVSYTYLKSATTNQLIQNGFISSPEKIIYLSDFGNYVMINPVMRYGEIEIPVLTKRQIYFADARGNLFSVTRDNEAEVSFTSVIVRQHPDFEEQLTNSLLYFYLHKKRFLDEDWFLNAFEVFYENDISVFGFNEIKENKVSPHKAKISILVTSGINWFNTEVSVTFGKKKASLKQIHKSIRNKSKFVQLGDGTMGILPVEWIEKFSDFFYAGEIVNDDNLIIPKVNFSIVEELYESEMLSHEVWGEIDTYRQKLNNFESIKEVPVPKGLKATLRDYQRQGLNWLNFLDDLNFGGCLADDMGLGKSIQVIAFILSQREKIGFTTNLLVVPTSLVFNWQQEIQKFAPSISVYVQHGSNRVKYISHLEEYDLIITTYGTLISDVNLLKEFNFNYIFLDESQNIKNPSSQRYQAARLLKAKNRFIITGTPIENNTFDIFGQLSFACPGLLGSKQFFRDIYSIPIDRFKDSKRAIELQKKIKPFILRRTKQEVAIELPAKTEMILYCEMGAEQRKVYDTHEKEFREFISNTGNDDIPKNAMHVLRGLTKLRQICNSPVLLGDEKLFADDSAKIQTLIEQIESKSSQHKILVFSQFVSMLDLIKKELSIRNINFEYLTGSTKDRASVVRNFQNNDEVRVFLISLKAGGTGLNLTQADYVYLVDPWWNPAVENQAIDRSYRIGQDKNVIAVRLITPNTIEEKIMDLQNTKKDLADELLSSETSFFKSLTKADLLNLVSPKV